MAGNHGGKRPGAGRKPGVRTSESQRYLTAKADKEEAIAEIRKHEAALKRKSVIPVDDIKAAWTTAAATAKERLLALPSRVAPELARETDPRKIEDIIGLQLNEVLTELADNANTTLS